MTSLYFDTTYLGKLHWPEPGSSEVAACAAAADELVCALHGRAEFHSISHRKLREGLADAHATRVVCAQYDADCASGAIRLLPLTDAIVNRVAKAFATAPSTVFVKPDAPAGGGACWPRHRAGPGLPCSSAGADRILHWNHARYHEEAFE